MLRLREYKNHTTIQTAHIAAYGSRYLLCIPGGSTDLLFWGEALLGHVTRLLAIEACDSGLWRLAVASRGVSGLQREYSRRSRAAVRRSVCSRGRR